MVLGRGGQDEDWGGGHFLKLLFYICVQVNKTETEDEGDSKQGQPEEVKRGVNLMESEKR